MAITKLQAAVRRFQRVGFRNQEQLYALIDEMTAAKAEEVEAAKPKPKPTKPKVEKVAD